MKLCVKLFGAEARLAGRKELELEFSGLTCAQLRAQLAETLPQLAGSLPLCRFAVNHEYVAIEHALREGDEVALIGMVSGG